MDNLTREQRSFNMSRIKSSNTKLELKFFSLLDKNHIAYVKHPKIFGKPDCQINNVLIFIDSDFWHGWHFKIWKHRLPQNYWLSKIEKNIARDKKKFRILRNHGYKVIRIWEHEFANEKKILNKILNLLNAES